MTKRRLTKIVFLVAVILVTLAAIAYVLSQKNPARQPPAKSAAVSANTSQASSTVAHLVSTNTFTYTAPKDWSKLTKAGLDAASATSGIIRKSPSAAFLIAIEPAATTPTSMTEINNSTLGSIKKLENFKLLSNVPTILDGQSGQKYSYQFTDKAIKKRQDLIVVVYKSQAYSLQFNSSDADYAGQSADFAIILNSFKFK